MVYLQDSHLREAKWQAQISNVHGQSCFGAIMAVYSIFYDWFYQSHIIGILHCVTDQCVISIVLFCFIYITVFINA